MTVNELIKELQELVEQGHGNDKVVSKEKDDIYLADVDPYTNNEVVIWSE